jgi:hypothetical protein
LLYPETKALNKKKTSTYIRTGGVEPQAASNNATQSHLGEAAVTGRISDFLYPILVQVSLRRASLTQSMRQVLKFHTYSQTLYKAVAKSSIEFWRLCGMRLACQYSVGIRKVSAPTISNSYPFRYCGHSLRLKLSVLQ